VNKRRRRIAAKQAQVHTVKLFLHFEQRGTGVFMLDQAVTRRRPERINHAGIDAEIVRRLYENTGKEVSA
jgi:hypothetical protein